MTVRSYTPAEERDLMIHIAKVYTREAQARRRGGNPGFAATLMHWAANARAKAMSIDVSAAQSDLFGEAA